VIFDSIVRASLKNIGNISPPIAFIPIQQKQDPLFFTRPRSIPLDHGIQMVMPSFPALFADSSWQMICNLSPFLWAINIHQMEKQFVFYFSPWTFHQRRI
jgi:hypothetical protein